MSALLRKLLLPIGAVALLSVSKNSLAQDSLSTSGRFSPQTNISSSFIRYVDNDPEIKKFYKSIDGFKGSVTRDFSENFRGEIGVSNSGAKSELKVSGVKITSDVSFLSFEGTMHYVSRWSGGGGAFYSRAGFSLTQMKSGAQGGGYSEQTSAQGTGFLLGGGIEFNFDDSSRIFGEINYKSFSGEIEMSGNEFLVGYKYALGKK